MVNQRWGDGRRYATLLEVCTGASSSLLEADDDVVDDVILLQILFRDRRESRPVVRVDFAYPLRILQVRSYEALRLLPPDQTIVGGSEALGLSADELVADVLVNASLEVGTVVGMCRWGGGTLDRGCGRSLTGRPVGSSGLKRGGQEAKRLALDTRYCFGSRRLVAPGVVSTSLTSTSRLMACPPSSFCGGRGDEGRFLFLFAATQAADLFLSLTTAGLITPLKTLLLLSLPSSLPPV